MNKHNIKDMNSEMISTTTDVHDEINTRLHQKPKYGECWGADMPFANISENRLAKTISMAVGCYHIDTLWIEVIFLDYFYAGDGNTEWKAGKCLQVTSAAENAVQKETKSSSNIPSVA